LAEEQTTPNSSHSAGRSVLGAFLAFVSLLLTGLLVAVGIVGFSLWSEFGNGELWDLVAPIAFVACVTLASWLATWAVFSDPSRD
jgi:hypothetical protein